MNLLQNNIAAAMTGSSVQVSPCTCGRWEPCRGAWEGHPIAGQWSAWGLPQRRPATQLRPLPKTCWLSFSSLRASFLKIFARIRADRTGWCNMLNVRLRRDFYEAKFMAPINLWCTTCEVAVSTVSCSMLNYSLKVYVTFLMTVLLLLPNTN